MIHKSVLTVVERSTGKVKVFRKLLQKTQLPVVYGDVVVDGVSLGDLLARHGVTTMLRREDFAAEERNRYCKRLLGQAPPDLARDRVSLYVCSECGDVACGAVGCRVEINDTYVRWYDFAWESVAAGDDLGDEDTEDVITEIQEFIFDRNQYESVLRAELASLR